MKQVVMLAIMVMASLCAQAEQNPQVQKILDSLVTVPAGEFRMGDLSDSGVSSEKPVHKVKVSSFNMMATEVTFDMWDACVAAGSCTYKPKDEDWGRGQRPVVNVSFEDITNEFIPWLNDETGLEFRLPSEAQWEYAARAGSTTKYYWGSSLSARHANGSAIYDWPTDGHLKSSKVGMFKPNAFGLYDMSGNVWEWCEDCWNKDYSGAPTDGAAWDSGECEQRVLRGGSWFSGPEYLRSATRSCFTASDRLLSFGFRLVQSN